MDKLSGVKDWTEYVEDAGKDPVLIDESENESEFTEE